MQMRKIWGVMLDAEFDPRAIADCRPIEFKKSMEGVGTFVPEEESAPPDSPGRSVGRSGPRRPSRKA